MNSLERIKNIHLSRYSLEFQEFIFWKYFLARRKTCLL